MVARVQVYDSAIASLFAPGGDVTREARASARQAEALAETYSAVFSPSRQYRPGYMKDARDAKIKGSHRIGVTPLPGALRVLSRISNLSPHAIYKHEGVMGIIVAKPGNKRGMRIPRGRWSPNGAQYKKQVRGQRSDPWMGRAVAATLTARYKQSFPQGFTYDIRS